MHYIPKLFWNIYRRSSNTGYFELKMISTDIPIHPRGVVIPKAYETIQRKAKRDLTQWLFTGPPGSRRKVPVYLFVHHQDGSIRVPCAWFYMQRFRYVRNVLHTSVRMQFNGSLREEQKQHVTKVIDVLCNEGASTMVMRTGGGKTVCALFIASVLGVKTLILVHKTFLLDQWLDRIHHFVPGIKTSVVSGPRRDMHGDIVVGMFQTYSRQSIDIHEDIGLVIVDEAHHVAASTFTQVMLRGSQKYTLGLSATPERQDGLDISPLTGDYVEHDAFHIKHTMDMSRVTVYIYKYSCDMYTEQPPVTRSGTVNYSSMVGKLVENTKRTTYICSLIRAITKPCLILTHRRTHVNDIVKTLRDYELDAQEFIPGKRDVPDSMFVVSTYQYASEGFDRKDLECLVMATPCKTTTQAIGRICRNMENIQHDPEVIDIQDQWSVFISSGMKRRCEYRETKYTVFVKHHKEDN